MATMGQINGHCVHGVRIDGPIPCVDCGRMDAFLASLDAPAGAPMDVEGDMLDEEAYEEATDMALTAVWQARDTGEWFTGWPRTPMDVEGDMLDEEAYEDADAHDVYGRVGGFFDPGAPSQHELYFDPETMQYADEPEEIWYDLAINKAGDCGRVVNWAHA